MTEITNATATNFEHHSQTCLSCGKTARWYGSPSEDEVWLCGECHENARRIIAALIACIRSGEADTFERGRLAGIEEATGVDADEKFASRIAARVRGLKVAP